LGRFGGLLPPWGVIILGCESNGVGAAVGLGGMKGQLGGKAGHQKARKGQESERGLAGGQGTGHRTLHAATYHLIHLCTSFGWIVDRSTLVGVGSGAEVE